MRIASFNVCDGGFDSHRQTASEPERLEALCQAVNLVDADVIALLDTFRWVELFSDGDLCQIFGYAQAFHFDMEDSRLDSRIGLTILAKGGVKTCRTLRIYNRNCLRLEVETDGKPVRVYATYLDDLRESVRLKQAQALLTDTENQPEVPMLIIGDLNSLRPANNRYLQAVLRSIATTLEPVRLPYLAAAAIAIARAEVLPLLLKKGFEDGGAKAPTATFRVEATRLRLPVALAIDYALYRGLSPYNYRVHIGGVFDSASDHRPISLEI